MEHPKETLRDVVLLASFFYPGFSSCRRRDAAAGVHVDEWEVVRQHPPSRLGPSKIIVPALGYTDASKPNVIAVEAELAYQHGIDAFIFNVYFDGTEWQLEGPLSAFASIKTPLKFAINVCCRMPRRTIPFGPHSVSEPLILLTADQFDILCHTLIERFLSHPDYLCSKGAALITFYHVDGFIAAYGLSVFRARVAHLRSLAAIAGHSIFLVGLFGLMSKWAGEYYELSDLPFDAISTYVGLPDFASNHPVQDFDALSQGWLDRWRNYCSPLPVIPCVGAGWDATARGRGGYDPKKHGLRFPYFPIVIRNTASNFERYLRGAVEIATNARQDFVFLGPFNEWSEGCYLLPDADEGEAKLQAIKRVAASMRL